jgi:hypothetical protein
VRVASRLRVVDEKGEGARRHRLEAVLAYAQMPTREIAALGAADGARSQAADRDAGPRSVVN